MSGDLIQWRPGCFAREGEEVTVDGVRCQFRGSCWWRTVKDGVHSSDVPAFLRSFPLPLDGPREKRRPGWGFGTARGRNHDRS